PEPESRALPKIRLAGLQYDCGPSPALRGPDNEMRSGSARGRRRMFERHDQAESILASWIAHLCFGDPPDIPDFNS
ncbi:MAG TPA: hypothetical protein VEL79_17010, partial [Vicinamibacterales bacterium]|nr:hypothetical protein [Vicinamibacterales bacterium]